MIPVKKLRFRDMFSMATNHTTHGIYYYPARFIPHVVRYCLETYGQPGQTVFDPFAGSGTVGVEASIAGLNSVLADINPMLYHLIRAKTLELNPEASWENKIKRCISTLWSCRQSYLPDWQNMEYWYPEDILETLGRLWAGTRALDSPLKPVLKMALLKVSREFSWDEDTAPKLFRSKRKTEKISALLKEDWKSRLKTKLEGIFSNYTKRVLEFNALLKTRPEIEVFAGVDTSESQKQLPRPFDLVITSPPYLMAQEYMRTSKLDLFWLGHTAREIKLLSSREIPYKKLPRNREDFYPIITEAVALDDRAGVSYFYHLFKALDLTISGLRAKGHLCVFVGNPVRKGKEIPVWRWILEWARTRDAEPVEVIEDPIVQRKLFGSRKNLNPSGMSSEFLVVMRKG